MEHTDVAVIGAGVLGCFAARALTERQLHVTVLEAREDVCTGITKANTGIVYTGLDTRPGTLKTQLCVRANREFERLCAELDVRFSRCGSLMAAFGPRAEAVLRRKFEQGQANGVPGLRLLDASETLEMEPLLSERVTMSLFAPGTGTVDPWELGIAAFENARANGADFRFNEAVLRMERGEHGYLLETCAGQYAARAVVNCAGLNADAVRELTKVPAVRIFPTAGEYLVLDSTVSGMVRHVIFHEPEEKGKGLTLVPTVDGNLLVGPTERGRDLAPDGATAASGLRWLTELCAKVAPSLPLSEQIRSFSALRPNPRTVREEGGVWVPEDRSINDFTLYQDNGLISLLGIKTPGLTCAAELGRLCAEFTAETLGFPGNNPRFHPNRRGVRRLHGMDEAQRAALVREDPNYGDILCVCRDVSRGEILEAIRRGAVTLDGVKRRTGAGMGRCQGARCLSDVLELLARAQRISPEAVTLDGEGSPVLGAKYGTC
jgi:glycerol-3-phosphate dehydrogenase